MNGSLVVSNHQSGAYRTAAANAGAAAYVFKDDIFDKLLPALALVLQQ